MKNYLKGIILGTTLVTGFMLASCKESSNVNFVKEANEQLAFSSTTALAMIDNNEGTKLMSNEIDYHMDLINQADLLINNGSGFEIKEEESDNTNYKHMQVVSFVDHENTNHTYKLYYNFVNTKTETEEDEVETKISYNGEIFIEDQIYKFDFESENESEDDEVEISSSLKIYTGDNSYIKIENENEKDNDETEEEFTYVIVKNGIELVNYSLSIEVESNETKVKIKLNGQEFKVSQEEKDNKKVVKVSINGTEVLYERVKNEDGSFSLNIIA